MFDRLNYTLSDFLLFSARVYERMFELHNEAWWPAHILALFVGAILMVAAVKPSPHRTRMAYVLLAMVWLFVAWAFFLNRYASINWAAVNVAAAFSVQALLFAALALRPELAPIASPGTAARRVGGTVLAFALLGYPLLPVLLGQSLAAGRMFAITPDPTVLATLAMLTFARGWCAVLASVIPITWSVITALTLWTLGSPEVSVAPVAVMACAVALCVRASPRRRCQ